MAYVTTAEAVTASRSSWANRSIAESQMTKSASAPTTTNFDVFLSHSYEDAEVIAGIKIMIEREGLSVYVDWIEDSQADRSKVTPATANMLRRRMNHCRFLLFATSKASPNSKWMPWELGYFDGMRHEGVGILPIIQTPTSSFAGQEYLGLYPEYEQIGFKGIGRRLGKFTGTNEGETLKAVVSRA